MLLDLRVLQGFQIAEQLRPFQLLAQSLQAVLQFLPQQQRQKLQNTWPRIVSSHLWRSAASPAASSPCGTLAVRRQHHHGLGELGPDWSRPSSWPFFWS